MQQAEQEDTPQAGAVLSTPEAREVLRRALAAGVEWVGVNKATGRPLMGCDPNDAAASRALSELREMFARDRAAMDGALWDYVMATDPDWRDDLAVVQHMGVTT